jgi:hypothetical protein
MPAKIISVVTVVLVYVVKVLELQQVILETSRVLETEVVRPSDMSKTRSTCQHHVSASHRRGSVFV